MLRTDFLRHDAMRPINCALILLALLIGSFSPDRQQAFAQTNSELVGPGPHFRADGPDAQAYGMGAGYPHWDGLGICQRRSLSRRSLQSFR